MAGNVYTIDELRNMIVPLAAKFGMASASLFGSYARGEATPDSDIDVLLVGKKGFRPLSVFGVAEELHRASGKQVDVYELSELDDGPFKDVVTREAVLL